MRTTSLILFAGALVIILGFMMLPFLAVLPQDLSEMREILRGVDALYGLSTNDVSYITLGYWLIPLSAVVALALGLFVQRGTVRALYGQLALIFPLSAQVILFLQFMQSLEETPLGILEHIQIGYGLTLLGLFIVLIGCIRVAIGIEYVFANE